MFCNRLRHSVSGASAVWLFIILLTLLLLITVAAPLYTLIYKRSLTTYPGLFNFVSSFLYLLSFVFIGWAWRGKPLFKHANWSHISNSPHRYVLRIKYRHKDHYAKVLKWGGDSGSVAKLTCDHPNQAIKIYKWSEFKDPNLENKRLTVRDHRL